VTAPYIHGDPRLEGTRRKLVGHLLTGCGFTKRRTRSAVAQLGARQVASNLGISEAWLRALLRDPTPTPKPKPPRDAFGPLCWTVPVFKNVPRPAYWIPIDVRGL
jgi:hypothetical protein